MLPGVTVVFGATQRHVQSPVFVVSGSKQVAVPQKKWDVVHSPVQVHVAGAAMPFAPVLDPEHTHSQLLSTIRSGSLQLCLCCEHTW